MRDSKGVPSPSWRPRDLMGAWRRPRRGRLPEEPSPPPPILRECWKYDCRKGARISCPTSSFSFLFFRGRRSISVRGGSAPDAIDRAEVRVAGRPSRRCGSHNRCGCEMPDALAVGHSAAALMAAAPAACAANPRRRASGVLSEQSEPKDGALSEHSESKDRAVGCGFERRSRQ